MTRLAAYERSSNHYLRQAMLGGAIGVFVALLSLIWRTPWLMVGTALGLGLACRAVVEMMRIWWAVRRLWYESNPGGTR